VDDMLGLGRLFADDTSIGHTVHDETTNHNNESELSSGQVQASSSH
jgi:hypothetical protein